MGKSTLIKNLFNEIEKDFIVIYIDIYNIITAEDFGSLLLNGITKSQKGDIKSIMLKTLKSSYFFISGELVSM